MKTKLAIVLIVMIFCLSPISAGRRMSNYKLEHTNFTLQESETQNIEIDYPQVTGLSDTEKQDRINALLKDEAFTIIGLEVACEERLAQDPEYAEWLTRVGLYVEYDVLFQSGEYLCVNYAGMFFARGAAHPTHLFSTVNIDMTTGEKLWMYDVINLDSDLVDTVRDYFDLYINNEVYSTVKFRSEIQDAGHFAVVYNLTLHDYRDDERFIKYFSSTGQGPGNSANFYITEDVFGIVFYVEYAAGNHYQIEIKREDIEKHLILKDLFD